MSTVLIVGASVGGVKTAQALRAAGHEGRIILVEAEAVPHPYDRPPLSKSYLSPDAGLSQIALVPNGDLDAIDVELITGVAATSLDPANKKLRLSDGTEQPYDTLVIATGARARPSPWGEGPGLHVLRTSSDAEKLRAELVPGRRILIVGAGFIGAEVAGTAVKAGLQVTMVDPLPAPMSRVLNEEVGHIFGQKHREEGVNTVLGHTVTSVVKAEDLFHVELSNAEWHVADAVLVGIGAIVNTEWLEGSGVALENGVLCGPDLAALGVDDIYAVGDVCRWTSNQSTHTMRLEHWTNAVDQALIAAHNIVSSEEPRHYDPVEYVWSDQYDWKIQVVGRTGSEDFKVVGSPGESRFAVTYSDGTSLVGAVIVNWPRALVACRRAVGQRTRAETVRADLEQLLATAKRSSSGHG
ncbi:FAD-dependent oxidoreductase [Paenarthrobacter nitroguajacolicus]|uniref:NAD(P)/FAD-dependent oxidoreductase n=1 Tax=Paenarthrobacter nitroguajacolicus TaxID=211146 RepID=UPI0015BE13D4|nr:FAD/NAD(P)-binding oxidoreductase [Paenarthrobacter nitroguajacolicus]NWL10412.1 FAD-dependent oxidoreductase [Paenarthrobacter nitroguajacolicus]